jgi:hypothetical protein
VLDDEKAEVSEKNAAVVSAIEKNQLRMVQERESHDELRKGEVKESEEYIAELEEKNGELGAPALDIKCGLGKQYDVEYELFCQEGMVYASSPQQLTKIVQAALNFLERTARQARAREEHEADGCAATAASAVRCCDHGSDHGGDRGCSCGRGAVHYYG